MFAAMLLCQVLLATAVFAIPTSKERFAQRLARRAGGFNHQSTPRQGVESAPVDLEVNAHDNVSNTLYSTNWAGAVLSNSTATWTSITGTFVVPTPKEPDSASGPHYATAWVGIDGYTCQTAILQTGVDFAVDGDNVGYYGEHHDYPAIPFVHLQGADRILRAAAWYEWFPAYQYYFSDISFKAGDTVEATVTATSKTGGTATITNKSTGQTVSHTFSNQPSLCEYDAEWIVEDFTEVGVGLAPFANFGKVTFTGPTATTNSGSSVGPLGATLLDIEQNGQVLTNTSVDSSSVTVQYIGP
ncbi:hypothetical protein GSI_00172 [Ganoderma sinense ZZ0214-1]|uniref:Uncharacterized protein n=1 Tax=Ganoderma sinense ZZ0214-1 TaxID=1077348 RepID=A0A2G8SRZ6_9APHY|nr:hypothetical protein GSI_00172 [Ganoderma sinense ZZ0214-1]